MTASSMQTLAESLEVSDVSASWLDAGTLEVRGKVTNNGTGAVDPGGMTMEAFDQSGKLVGNGYISGVCPEGPIAPGGYATFRGGVFNPPKVRASVAVRPAHPR